MIFLSQQTDEGMSQCQKLLAAQPELTPFLQLTLLVMSELSKASALHNPICLYYSKTASAIMDLHCVKINSKARCYLTKLYLFCYLHWLYITNAEDCWAYVLSCEGKIMVSFHDNQGGGNVHLECRASCGCRPEALLSRGISNCALAQVYGQAPGATQNEEFCSVSCKLQWPMSMCPCTRQYPKSSLKSVVLNGENWWCTLL